MSFIQIIHAKQSMNRSHYHPKKPNKDNKYTHPETHLLFHISKQPPHLGSQMNHMRRLIFLKYLIGIPPHSQVTVLRAQEDPRLARFGVGISVGLDGLADEARSTGDKDGGDGVSFCVVFGHVVVTRAEVK